MIEVPTLMFIISQHTLQGMTTKISKEEKKKNHHKTKQKPKTSTTHSYFHEKTEQNLIFNSHFTGTGRPRLKYFTISCYQ